MRTTKQSSYARWAISSSVGNGSTGGSVCLNTGQLHITHFDVFDANPKQCVLHVHDFQSPPSADLDSMTAVSHSHVSEAA
jgi:nicotinamide mononucleotide (NMN) deamidase PncC